MSRPGNEPGSPPWHSCKELHCIRTAYTVAIRNFYICRPEPLQYPNCKPSLVFRLCPMYDEKERGGGVAIKSAVGIGCTYMKWLMSYPKGSRDSLPLSHLKARLPYPIFANCVFFSPELQL
jgi:hypothetical protein